MQTLAQEIVQPDEDQLAQEFITFLARASVRRHPQGTMRRFNQARHTACVHGEFVIDDALPPDLRVGLFADPATYTVQIRFANATSASDLERDVRGMSIRLLDVAGENLTAGATVQDFVLNSHPVMMVPGTREFLELLQANETGGSDRVRYFLTHPKAALIAFRSRQHHTSHLDIPYWSTTPYLFGPVRAVKYIARPTGSLRQKLPRRLTGDYLRTALAAHLRQADATFDFLVQFQRDVETMPIEDASVEWTEHDSPYRRIARIRIPEQSIDGAEREAFCEQVAFNPWHALPEHRPLGSFNRARRSIYSAMAGLREARRVAT